MFAIVKTGGKQYKVAKDSVIKIEKIDGNVKDTITFSDILVIGTAGASDKDAKKDTKIGAPFIKGAHVKAEIVEQGKGPKLISFIKRRRKHGSQRTRGHRQQLTTVRITSIHDA